MKKTVRYLLAMCLVLSLSACDAGFLKNKNVDIESDSLVPKASVRKFRKVISGRELAKNLHARKAIAYAIDKKYITKKIVDAGAEPIDFFVPNKFAKYENNYFRSRYPNGWLHHNIEKAKEEWSIAKSRLNFEQATLQILTIESKPHEKEINEFIKSQLESTLEGLTVELKITDYDEAIVLCQNGDFDVAVTDWGPDYPDPMTFLDLWSEDNRENFIKFSQTEYNSIIKDCKEGELAEKPLQRWSALQEAERILVDQEAVIVPLYQEGSCYLQKPWVKNIVKHDVGGWYTYKHATTKPNKDGKRIISKLSLDNIQRLDPNLVTGLCTETVLCNVMENLVMLDENDNITEGVAKEWKRSENGKVYVFTLRDSKWSNGEPVTAYDFVYSWQRLARKSTNSLYRTLIKTLQFKNYKEILSGQLPEDKLGVQAIDAKTLMVELEKPVSFFLETLTLPHFSPINKRWAQKQGKNLGKDEKSLLYNGAYVITKRTGTCGYTLAKNPNYWNAASVKNDGVEVIQQVKKHDPVAMYKNGEIDILDLHGDLLRANRNSVEYNTALSNQIYYLTFNVR